MTAAGGDTGASACSCCVCVYKSDVHIHNILLHTTAWEESRKTAKEQRSSGVGCLLLLKTDLSAALTATTTQHVRASGPKAHTQTLAPHTPGSGPHSPSDTTRPSSHLVEWYAIASRAGLTKNTQGVRSGRHGLECSSCGNANE